MSLTVVYDFNGCITVDTGMGDEGKATKKALTSINKALSGLIANQMTIKASQPLEEVDNDGDNVTFEIVGTISIPTTATDNQTAESDSWKILMSHNHKHIIGLGDFEYHDGEIISISPTVNTIQKGTSKVTTEDCKKFLVSQYPSTTEEQWKRTKKYKVGEDILRDFVCNSLSHKVTLTDKNGQLLLVTNLDSDIINPP